MENAINSLRIRNFKSIKDVTLQPRRVNLIIGQPNVGKSNVLEALSLLGAGLYERGDKFLGDVVRYEQVSNLFYDNDTSVPVIIDSNVGAAVLRTEELSYVLETNSASLLEAYSTELERRKAKNKEGISVMLGLQPFYWGEAQGRIKQTIQLDGQSYFQAFINAKEDGQKIGARVDASDSALLPKLYRFISGQPHNATALGASLEPPLGRNLWEAVQRHPALRKEVAALFRQYGQKLVMRVGERKFEIQKEEEDMVYTTPYALIADTLQRIIFYTAAIESNKDSVLLFEEPEAHSYPEYVTRLARRMVDSKTNQFFVATHSPYLFTEVVEQMLPDEEQASDLAIFVAYYEDYQTKIHQLSDEQMRSIRRDTLDVFLNMRRFIPRRADV